MSREPNFTGQRSPIYVATPQPSPLPPQRPDDPADRATADYQAGRISREVFKTIMSLIADVDDVQRRGQQGLLDDAAGLHARGGQLAPGTVARILRRTAGMVYDSPPPWEPGPVPASLPALRNASMDGDW